MTKATTSQMVRILGVDPGSVVTGYGVIETDGIRNFHVAHGHIRVEGDSFPEKLGHIHHSLNQVLDQWHPDEAAVEQVFLSNNAMSALKLGQARGAAICALVARALPVAEYTARAVKQAVVGSGAADKKQVQVMVKTLLGVSKTLQADAADGLAISICHANTRLSVSTGRSRRRSRSLRL